MNSIAILNNGQQLTMSSREIAWYVGTQRDSVLKTIRQLVDRGIVSGNETTYTHHQNQQTYPEFLLDYRNSMVVVSGYSAEVRAKIIDRWQELEAKQAKPVFQVPTTLSSALRLAADQAEVIEQQKEQISLAKPKVEFFENYVQAKHGSMGLREVCKILRAKENEFVSFLLERGFMYRITKESPLTPKSDHIHNGRFEAKTGVSRTTEHAFVHYKFTSKGVEWIAGEWGKNQVRELF